MRPVLTAAEMRTADAAAQAEIGIDTLIARAGFAVATRALARLGGAYGRRVVVLAGRGHNGDDGRVAAAHLARRGARVEVLEPNPSGPAPIGADLVIDACYGTGFHGRYDPPVLAPGTEVLAVDLPSGLDGDTGVSNGGFDAAETVTFAALKPGLLLGSGPARSGTVVVADIGLETGIARIHLVEDSDIASVPARRRDGHKWDAAVYVVAGSPGMYGAAVFAATGALRAGAGMVRLAAPGVAPGTIPVLEAVQSQLPDEDFASALLAEVGRTRCIVLGPGIGTGEATRRSVREVLARATVPVVLDADGLNALGSLDEAAGVLGAHPGPLVMTPHEGEFTRLTGAPPGEDRIGAVRDLARRARAVVLLKGATTVVADEDGTVWLAAAGSTRLATAGTGDVLSGVIAALVARGLAPGPAAAIAAHVHGRAGRGGAGALLAGDLPALVGDVLSAAGR